jgi:hypothetical protein
MQVNTYTYSLGTIKTTTGQQKKHISQMKNQEVSYLLNKINKLNFSRLYVSKHLLEKDISFKVADIYTILKTNDYEIIEYNETEMFDSLDQRVLIRSKAQFLVQFIDEKTGRKYNVQSNMCFVLSLRFNKVITLYWNMTKDSHKSINWKRYNSSLKVIK